MGTKTPPLKRASTMTLHLSVLEVDGHGDITQDTATHTCNGLPVREGYHVILAVWDVGDTDKAFYNTIDVVFDGDDSQLPGWEKAGQIIIPTMNLKEG
ncbi:lytic polysaccharide monooxygenase [Vibrio chagasii]|nr:lytic polysaccharide monooxygenase [Vibrio chagasii]